MNKQNNAKKIPKPCDKEVEKFIKDWNKDEKYVNQEKAVNLVFKMYPGNKTLEEVLIKSACLNVFYSTSIFNIYPVAENIVKNEKKIDAGLNSGNIATVEIVANCKINKDVTRVNYSFATKYCSHHRPDIFPIYDSYVDEMLRQIRNQYGVKFFKFKNDDLRNYEKFCEILQNFRKCFGLEKYSLKDIDKYLWRAGKHYFPAKDKKKTKK